MIQLGQWHLLQSRLVTDSCKSYLYKLLNCHDLSLKLISFDVLISSAIKAPKYLREAKYIAPSEPTDGFVQYANQTKYNVFEYLQSHPSLFQDFNLFMGNTMGAREYWHEWYDVENRLLSGFNSSHNPNLLVDVGGGKGHDIMAFRSTFSHHSGRLILQDLPQVLDSIPERDIDPNILKVAYDFFDEQPIKGKRY